MGTQADGTHPLDCCKVPVPAGLTLFAPLLLVNHEDPSGALG